MSPVTSAGPVDGKRRKELKDLFAGCKAGLVFVAQEDWTLARKVLDDGSSWSALLLDWTHEKRGNFDSSPPARRDAGVSRVRSRKSWGGRVRFTDELGINSRVRNSLHHASLYPRSAALHDSRLHGF